MNKNSGGNLSYDASDFVSLSEEIPEAILDIRYFSANNFIGARRRIRRTDLASD